MSAAQSSARHDVATIAASVFANKYRAPGAVVDSIAFRARVASLRRDNAAEQRRAHAVLMHASVVQTNIMCYCL